MQTSYSTESVSYTLYSTLCYNFLFSSGILLIRTLYLFCSEDKSHLSLCGVYTGRVPCYITPWKPKLRNTLLFSRTTTMLSDVISKIFIMLYHNDTAELKKKSNCQHICISYICSWFMLFALSLSDLNKHIQ